MLLVLLMLLVFFVFLFLLFLLLLPAALDVRSLERQALVSGVPA